MMVTLLTVASFLVSLTAFVMLWIANRGKSWAKCESRSAHQEGPGILLSVEQAFDPLYAMLWDAPIAVLQVLDSAEASGVPPHRLRPIFSGTAGHFPEIYEGCTFPQWVRLLQDMELVDCRGGRMTISESGRRLLAVLKDEHTNRVVQSGSSVHVLGR
jgi:hypothetical protein